MLYPNVIKNKWEQPHFYGSIYGLEEASALLEVLSEGAPTNGKRVREFEKQFSHYVGAEYGVATNSWGGAAHIVAISLDIQEGDEFIVPAIAMSASANFFVREGAKIVFAESDPKTFNIDPKKLEKYITPKTRAIVAVHMCGQPVEMDSIMEIAKKHNLVVIQDAAHAPGALYKGNALGKYGDYSIYSFHQAKNMCTLGEGGMVVVNDKDIAIKLSKIRVHGSGEYIGVSNKMTDIQAAVGLIQLQRLPIHTEIRRKLAYYLNELLSGIEGISIPYELDDIYHVYHLYNIILDEEKVGITKKEFIERLWRKSRIMSISYSPTVNCLNSYKKLGHYEGECPISEKIALTSIVFPIAPWFCKEEMFEISQAIKAVLMDIGKEI